MKPEQVGGRQLRYFDVAQETLCVGGWVDGWMDWWMGGWMDGWVGGWMVG